MKRHHHATRVLLIVGPLLVGFGLGMLTPFTRGAPALQEQVADEDDRLHLRQSPGAVADRPSSDWGLGDHHASRLPAYPPGKAGDRTPFDLWRYAGR